MNAGPRDAEDGYVLIAAIWLLALAGAIAAYLMLQSLTATRQARSEGDILRARLALEAAVETIIADRIMNGGRSIWSQTPAEGSIQIDDIAIRVRATNEAQRIDLVRADPRLIDAALRTAGLGAEQRQGVIARAALQRSDPQPASIATMRSILGQSPSASGPCLISLFTPFPGGQTIETMRAAPQGPVSSEPLMAGHIQRLELEAPQGAALTVLVRVTGQRGEAASILDWQPHRLCID